MVILETRKCDSTCFQPASEVFSCPVARRAFSCYCDIHKNIHAPHANAYIYIWEQVSVHRSIVSTEALCVSLGKGSGFSMGS